MKIVKIYPHNYSLHKNQNSSIVLASMPYTKGSVFSFVIVSPYTENPIEDDNIIFIAKEDCFDTEKKMVDQKLWSLNSGINYNKYLDSVIQVIQMEIPDLIEVEFDIKLASDIGRTVKTIPVSLVNHLSIIKSSPIYNMKKIFNIININAFVFVSYYFRKKFLQYYPFFKNKSYIVHNSYAHVSHDIVEMKQKKNQIIFVGRATLRKGIKEYLESVSLIVQKYPLWQAVFIGSIEREKEQTILNELKNIPVIAEAIALNKLKIYKNISNIGVFNFLKESKIAVFPTIPSKHKEGIPLVALEAIMAKCLVLSSISGGFPEINPFAESIIHKITSQDIVKRIDYFINNHAKLEEIQVNQYNFVINNFKKDTLLKEFDNIRYNIISTYKKSRFFN